jgi:hypothetical protein
MPTSLFCLVCSGGRMVLNPKEPADVHQLMAQDAQPNIRVWQVRPTTIYYHWHSTAPMVGVTWDL